MPNVYKITDKFAVSEQIQTGDVDAIVAAGFKVVICNRPDDEDPGQPAATDIAAVCEAMDIAFHFLPFTGNRLSDELIAAFREILDATTDPIFAYCRSGQRCAFLWNTAMR